MSARRTNGTDSADSAKTLKAGTLMGVWVELFVGSALSGADPVLVCEEAGIAITIVCSLVIVRVHGTSDTVSIANKVVSGTFLTDVTHESETFKTLAFTGLNVINRVLTAHVNAFLRG